MRRSGLVPGHGNEKQAVRGGAVRVLEGLGVRLLVSVAQMCTQAGRFFLDIGGQYGQGQGIYEMSLECPFPSSPPFFILSRKVGRTCATLLLGWVRHGRGLVKKDLAASWTKGAAFIMTCVDMYMDPYSETSYASYGISYASYGMPHRYLMLHTACRMR